MGHFMAFSGHAYAAKHGINSVAVLPLVHLTRGMQHKIQVVAHAAVHQQLKVLKNYAELSAEVGNFSFGKVPQVVAYNLSCS
jgi:hypothetical protein